MRTLCSWFSSSFVTTSIEQWFRFSLHPRTSSLTPSFIIEFIAVFDIFDLVFVMKYRLRNNKYLTAEYNYCISLILHHCHQAAQQKHKQSVKI